MKGKISIILMGLILAAGGLFLVKPRTASKPQKDGMPREASVRKIDLILPGTYGPVITLEWQKEEWMALSLTDEAGRKEIYRENRKEPPGLLPESLFYGSPEGENRGPYRLEWSSDGLNRLNRMKLYYSRSPIRQYHILYIGSSRELKSLRVLDGQGRYLYSLGLTVF